MSDNSFNFDRPFPQGSNSEFRLQVPAQHQPNNTNAELAGSAHLSHYLIHENTPNYGYGSLNHINPTGTGTIFGASHYGEGTLDTTNFGSTFGVSTFRRTSSLLMHPQPQLSSMMMMDTRFEGPTPRHQQQCSSSASRSSLDAPSYYNRRNLSLLHSRDNTSNSKFQTQQNSWHHASNSHTDQTMTGTTQPLESDRDEDFSEKLIAFARYNRNITLIKEILSDVVMPDPRHFVTSSRLEALREQVRVLEEHYKKVDLELKDVQTACSERKRLFMESTAAFKTKYEPLCRPAVGIKTYSELFLKHYNQCKLDAERQQWEQTLAWAQQTAGTTTTPQHTIPDTRLADIFDNKTEYITDAGAESEETNV